ncbi:MAG TPA: TraB/GumN family protein [Roseiarcus sp.]|nr:TraB/GumN family protein [Roseiarcus sp.]
MKSIFFLCGLGLLWILSAAAAAVAAPPACQGTDLTRIAGLATAKAKRADDLVNDDGVFWRIDKPGLDPSYLFGAIHSTDDSALALARRATERIGGARVVATELGGPLDAAAKADAGAAMLRRALDRENDTFEDAPPADRAAIEKLVAARGYPSAFAHHLKLWFLAVLTAIPHCEAQRQALDLPEVDQLIAQSAKASGVKVVGLETVGEQLDAISALRPRVAAVLLAVAARDPGLNDDVYATLLRLYRESRPAEILPISDALGEMSEEERAAEDEFTRLLLAGRNATMAERIAPLLRGGGAFIAVGALHLPGRGGLIERLRAQGYMVTKVW